MGNLKKITKYFLPLLCSVFILKGCLNNCSTTIKPLDKSKLRKEVKISKNSDIGRYFKEKKLPLKKISGKLEKIIENDFSRIFNQDIDFVKINYGSMGYLLFITKKGSLDIIGTKNFFKELTNQEKIKIKYLAEIYGPKISSIDLNFYLENFNKKDLEKKEKQYSVFLMEKSGYALPLIFRDYIKINKNGMDTLYNSIQSVIHEGTHTLIYNQSSIKYLKEYIFSYLDWNDNYEIINIHETSCEIITDKIKKYFKKHHLIKNSKIYNDYIKTEKFSKEYGKEIQKLIKEYESIPLESRIIQCDKLFRDFKQKIKKKYDFKVKINEARLSMCKRYSGDKKIEDKLNFLYNRLGPNKFIKLIPTLYNLNDLDKIYNKHKSEK